MWCFSRRASPLQSKHQTQSTTSKPKKHSSTASDSKSRVDSLISDIEAHRKSQASSLSTARRGSTSSLGTMFVDVNDETGEMEVSYRNREKIPREIDMKIRERRRGGFFVSGTDRASGFDYDYDGRVMHVHRNARRGSSSTISDYYELDAKKYEPGADVIARSDEDTDDQAPKNKQQKEVDFIRTLIQKFDNHNIWKRFKEEAEPLNKKMRKKSGRRRKATHPKSSHSDHSSRKDRHEEETHSRSHHSNHSSMKNRSHRSHKSSTNSRSEDIYTPKSPLAPPSVSSRSKEAYVESIADNYSMYPNLSCNPLPVPSTFSHRHDTITSAPSSRTEKGKEPMRQAYPDPPPSPPPVPSRSPKRGRRYPASSVYSQETFYPESRAPSRAAPSTAPRPARLAQPSIMSKASLIPPPLNVRTFPPPTSSRAPSAAPTSKGPSAYYPSFLRPGASQYAPSSVGVPYDAFSWSSSVTELPFSDNRSEDEDEPTWERHGGNPPFS
ncbi:unnamed protein product [Periconia digitata]|uniref:Uncharacterized protein n=1 Tax=Periconia digitata TaxID=1303443 RepID=A0A9W4XSY7_9PLEO|nr:unnamed protein product [Periconia digitata]